MRGKCINSISGCKSVTRNAFSDIDFLYDVESFAVRRCFSSILAIFTAHMHSFDYTTTSGLQCDVIFEFSAPVFTA